MVTNWMLYGSDAPDWLLYNSDAPDWLPFNSDAPDWLLCSSERELCSIILDLAYLVIEDTQCAPYRAVIIIQYNNMNNKH